VLFPNTTPPFYPSNAITASGPKDAREYEYRFAGLQAHNRWLADFCNATPGRRAGLAQVFLEDIDGTVAEIRQAKANGLMGILLPNDHVLSMANLYYPKLDPIWQVCSELNLPVHRHGVRPTESNEISGPAGAWIGNLEVPFYGLRAVAHLVCSGVFDRFPDLRLVATEINESSPIPDLLARIDASVRGAIVGSLQSGDILEPANALHRTPSTYFATNCWVGNAFDLRAALVLDVPNQMWGADIPHAEGCSPYTLEALRLDFSSLSSELTERTLSGHAFDVYGFDRPLLESVAQRIGPRVADVHTTMTAGEVPAYPAQTRSPTFVPGRVAELVR
jgi:predicted TIM-barrel fold metal-dependent hydrolase